VDRIKTIEVSKEYNMKEPEMKHTQERNNTRISEGDLTEKIH
jgi:hypothetical protein